MVLKEDFICNFDRYVAKAQYRYYLKLLIAGCLIKWDVERF